MTRSSPLVLARTTAARAAAAFLLLAGPCIGRDSHPGIIGPDDRVRVEDQGAPWDAVGQVNIGGYRSAGRCTGTLIAPDLVLTAAHCVMDAVRKMPQPVKNIHFLARVRGSASKGHAMARCLRFPDGHDVIAPDRKGGVPLAAFIKDVAVIVLKEPLDVEPAPIAVNFTPGPDQRLVHAAYPADRRFALTVHRDCRLLASTGKGSVWLNDCDTHPAGSGGPVFVETGSRLAVAAVMVGAGARDGNVALPASEWLGLTQDNACP